MNMMTLQRFRNELILLLAILFALGAFLYKVSANSYVTENRTDIQQQITEIKLINGLKKQWGNRQTGNKVKILKTVVPNAKVASFSKKSKKLVASYKNLTGHELSKVTNKLINLPVQLVLFNVKQSANKQYTLEFTCKW